MFFKFTVLGCTFEHHFLVFSRFLFFLNILDNVWAFAKRICCFNLWKSVILSIFELFWKFWTAHFSLKLVWFTTRKWNLDEILRRGYGLNAENPRFLGGGVEKLPYIYLLCAEITKNHKNIFVAVIFLRFWTYPLFLAPKYSPP